MAAQSKSEQSKRVSCRISSDLYEGFIRTCERTRDSPSEIIRNAVVSSIRSYNTYNRPYSKPAPQLDKKPKGILTMELDWEDALSPKREEFLKKYFKDYDGRAVVINISESKKSNEDPAYLEGHLMDISKIQNREWGGADITVKIKDRVKFNHWMERFGLKCFNQFGIRLKN